ncbi:MAG: NAD-dependent epimerase/dehydratase family protein [Candidatus Hodarchaeota archaeon]
MKVAITGATGFIGMHLLRAILKRGWAVKLLVLDSDHADPLEELGVEILRGDLTHRESLDGFPGDANLVYHLAGQLGRGKISYRQMYSVNVEGTKNLLDRCVNSKIQSFIHCSAAGVIGIKGELGAKETAPYAPASPYETTKYHAERLVLDYAERYGLPVTVLRPCFVYGPGDLHKLRFFRAISKRKFHLLDDGSALWHPTFIDDVIQAFLLAAENEIQGEVFNIAGPAWISVKEFAETIASCLGTTIPKLKIPRRMAYLAAYCLETVCRNLNIEPPLSPTRVKFLTTHFCLDISKSKEMLGYTPRVEPMKGVEHTVKWYKEHGFLA